MIYNLLKFITKNFRTAKCLRGWFSYYICYWLLLDIFVP